ncbi:hypothetical protein D3C87_2049700 [compost metagenome]
MPVGVSTVAVGASRVTKVSLRLKLLMVFRSAASAGTCLAKSSGEPRKRLTWPSCVQLAMTLLVAEPIL